MAAKRFFDGDDEDQPNQKRMKTRPSFASVIREVVMVNFFENFCSALEPMLRRVVSEEVENGVRRLRCMSSILAPPPRSLKMIQHETPTTSSTTTTRLLQLTFSKPLSFPIFTGTKIVDSDNNPLQIFLLETTNHHHNHHHGRLMKLEMVVLDGDFPNGDTWTNEEFTKNIVRERSGKRPLLTGDNLNNIPMRDGVAFVGDIEFTDNSSWIRSRKFRLGARVVQVIKGDDDDEDGVVIIREAMTEAFVVKDHRGELYKKHHPPALEDEVWRLEKIGKGGAFHQKLSSHGINTVQDFLKLFFVDSSKLRKILGVGMSEKMWESTLKHAKTCVMGTKLYRYHGNNYTLTFNPICQLIKAEFNHQIYLETDFKNMQTAYIKSLVKDAYVKWSSLEEFDGLVHDNALLTQGEGVVGQCPNQQQQLVVRSSSYVADGMHDIIISDGVDDQGVSVYSDDWPLLKNINYLPTNTTTKTGIRFFSESSSEGDIL